LVFESGTEQTKCNSCERIIGVTSCDGLAQMSDYRVYVIGNDGHFVSAIQLDCADDNAAIESAKQFVNGHDVELWQRDRIVAKLDRKPDGI
jgi:hypothetical protein